MSNYLGLIMRIFAVLLFLSFCAELQAEQDPKNALPTLHQAVINGDLDKVKQLVKSGADVNQLDKRMGNSPLHIAAQTDHTDIMVYLIEQGAFINLQTPRSGFTPLMTAAWYSKAKNIKALLAYPELNIELTNRTGGKAQDFVGGWDNSVAPHEAKLYQELTDLLLQHRTKQEQLLAEQKVLNTIDDPTLTDAVKAKKIERLLRQGQDVNQRRPVYSSRNDWHTPLLVASRDGLTLVVKVLLAHGADQTIPGFPMDAIPFHKAGYMGHPEIVRMLIADKNAEKVINAQGPNNGYTPLHDAIWHGHTNAAKAFIEGGARLDLTNFESDTPEQTAKRYGYNDIVALLKDKTNR